MCQFDHLSINEDCTLYEMSRETKCTVCSSLTSYTGPAIYRGHRDNNGVRVDWFDITGNWICKCGEKIYHYIEPCQDDGYLDNVPSYIMDFESIIKR